MITIDHFEEWIRTLAGELPDAFHKDLNGGIHVIEREKYHPASRRRDLLIMGEYLAGGVMGRCVHIYYGSFARAYGHLSEEALVHEMRRVLRHEFRHHVESLAGERDLNLEDEQNLRDYLSAREDHD